MTVELSIARLLPQEILATAGKSAYGSSKWLSRNAMITGQDEDWSTPFGVVKVISYGEKTGSHVGLWFGLGPERPVVVVFSGLDYGGFIRPISIKANDLPAKIGIVGRPSNVRKIFQNSSWMEEFSDLVPNMSATNVEREFFKTPLFARDGDAANSYTDFLLPHRKILETRRKDPAMRKIAEFFAGDDDLLNYENWLRMAKWRIEEAGLLEAFPAMETAQVVFRHYGPGRIAYPEVIFLQRDFIHDRIMPLISGEAEWMASLLHAKWRNLSRLAVHCFSELKERNPQKYMDLITKGYSAS